MSSLKHWLVLHPHPDAETFIAWDEETAEDYRRDGYRVDGPFDAADSEAVHG